LFGCAQDSLMSDDRKNPKHRESEVEFWARALGVSPHRLIALVEEVVKERLSPGVSLVPENVPVSE